MYIYKGHVIDFLLGLFVCMSVIPSLPLVRFGHLLLCSDKLINERVNRKEQLASLINTIP